MPEPWIHCNACGRQVPLSQRIGNKWAVCSDECVREMEWRSVLSILRKPYEPSPEVVARAKAILGEDTKEGGAR